MTSNTPTQLTRRPGDHYTAEQIEDGLTAMVHAHGSSRVAAKLLEEQGRPIPFQTLQAWKTIHAKRLSELEKQVSDEIWRKTARKWRRVVEDAQDGALEAIEATRSAITADDPKAASAWSGTSKNLGIIGGIGTEKAAGIDGRPMHHTDVRGLPDILRQLERYPGMVRVNRDVVDSTATELPASSNRPSRGTQPNEAKDPELAA